MFYFHSNKLSVKGHANNFFFGSACQLSKAKQFPFTESSSRQSLILLTLVHSDVWVSLVKSIGGYKYYVLFDDDYSRYSWLYPLQ